MSRRRCELAANELPELHDRLARQLDRIGLETQPTVALRLLDLVQDPESSLKQYTDVIKNDWTLTGRLLKLANSAYYAQRSPVTKLDRALVLLGLERTKAISLGFYLSRSASAPDAKDVSRAVWGESVYRAGLCSALAKSVCPSLAAEAFIVGLMLDCGQPLMAKLVGPDYATLRASKPGPAPFFAAEFDQLEFTHVDIATVLMQRWKLPALLARPISWHHTLPAAGKTADSATLLQRIAYYGGAIRLSAEALPDTQAPLAGVASGLLDLDSAALTTVIQKAGGEYKATIDLFSDLANRVGNVEDLAEQVHFQLTALMDEQVARTVQLEGRNGADCLSVGGQRIELEPARKGEVIAFIASERGERIISCTINPATDSPEKLCHRLGIESAQAEEMEELMRAVRAMAA